MPYQRLIEISDNLISDSGDLNFIRSELCSALAPPHKNVTILKGARSVGKSTLLQQFLFKQRNTGCNVLYISADSTLLTTPLAEFAHEYYKRDGEVLTNLYPADKSYKDFQKPQKIFLNNTNSAYAYSPEPGIGTIRETFVANCLQNQGELTAPTFGDFCLNGEYTFEIGGRSKNRRQVKSVKNSYVFADNILSAEDNKLPLWLLVFLW